jgi:hypothetical protein
MQKAKAEQKHYQNINGAKHGSKMGRKGFNQAQKHHQTTSMVNHQRLF